ncbi:MAG: transcriptional regulator [Actinomycetota bacterium]|nr:transcriptional regulator [Actinomycetota bacterium]
MNHPRHGLDRNIHQPVPLSIVAALWAAKEIEFGVVRDTVGISDSVLSRQASGLEAIGYVAIRKGYVGKRPRTWLSLTPAGRDALEQHLAALRDVVAGLPQPVRPARVEAVRHPAV